MPLTIEPGDWIAGVGILASMALAIVANRTSRQANRYSRDASRSASRANELAEASNTIAHRAAEAAEQALALERRLTDVRVQARARFRWYVDVDSGHKYARVIVEVVNLSAFEIRVARFRWHLGEAEDVWLPYEVEPSDRVVKPRRRLRAWQDYDHEREPFRTLKGADRCTVELECDEQIAVDMATWHKDLTALTT